MKKKLANNNNNYYYSYRWRRWSRLQDRIPDCRRRTSSASVSFSRTVWLWYNIITYMKTTRKFASVIRYYESRTSRVIGIFRKFYVILQYTIRVWGVFAIYYKLSYARRNWRSLSTNRDFRRKCCGRVWPSETVLSVDRWKVV